LVWHNFFTGLGEAIAMAPLWGAKKASKKVAELLGSFLKRAKVQEVTSVV